MTIREISDRRGTHSAKWDMLEPLFGITAPDAISMWIAEMDVETPDFIHDVTRQLLESGTYGYPGDFGGYLEAVKWWEETRHGWTIDTDWILTTYGLGNAIGIAIDALTAPGDGVIVFTPVYREFLHLVGSSGRRLVECQLAVTEGRHTLDFDAYEAQMTGTERLMILSSPHNPGGRVWTRAELSALAAFARRHELIILSDEIHQDIVYGPAKHIPFALIDGVEDRLITLSAPSKTFNLPGARTGQIIIADPDLRERFKARMAALSIGMNGFGPFMTEAAYTPAGAAWVDALVAYLDENRQMFDAAVGTLPGVSSMPLESTFLAWVDFAGTGLSPTELRGRVQSVARIAASPGPSFGTGGENHLRFNFALPRATLTEAIGRLSEAFGDLQ